MTTAMPRQDPIAARTQKLAEAVQALSTDEGLRTFIALRRKLASYSFRNKILIAMQRPDARFVAGFAQWHKQYGRKVRKGQKGILILAPLTGKREDEISGEQRQVVLGFRNAWVFDIAQTEPIPGKEHLAPKLPDVEDPTWPDGNTCADMSDRLRTLAAGYGTVVEPRELQGASGSYDKTANKISLDPRLGPGEELSVLVHELAHAFDHKLGTDNGYDAGEWVAETSAAVVLAGLGGDTTASSARYIAVYGGNAKALSAITRRVGQIVDLIEEGMAESDA